MINCIYKIENLCNAKIYIGQTWSENLQKYFNRSHVSVRGRTKLYNAIKKYGKTNFIITAIDCATTQEEADKLESFYIEKYNSIKNGYNLRSGGSHGKHSEYSKQLIARASKNRLHSEEVKKKISLARKGMKFSVETKHKMSNAKIGKHVGPQTEFKVGHILNRKFSITDEIKIIEIYGILKSSYKVAKVFGCSNVTVLNIVKRHYLSGNKTELSKESE